MVVVLSPQTCRVCLQNSESGMLLSLFSSEGGGQPLCEKLSVCCGLSVAENDGFPDKICRKCAENLPIAYSFVSLCRVSDTYLKTLLLNGEYSVPDETEVFDDVDRDSEAFNTEDTKRGGRSRIKCTDCGVTTANQAAMIIHKRKHTNEKPFNCGTCQKAFRSKGLMQRHISTYHSKRERKFVCEICGNSFFRKNDILVHMRRHTGDTPYACSLCPRAFKQHSTLARHTRTHTGLKPFPCRVCGKAFADRTMVKRHLDVHSTERPHRCHICNKLLKSKIALKNHIIVHGKSRVNVCHHCGVAFSSKPSLKKHIDKVHSESSGFCPVCAKHFSDLPTHLRKHTGEKPFACDACSATFISERSLHHHAKYKHLNADKYKCLEKGCNKTFPVEFYFEVHKLKHHSDKRPFVCHYCSRGFCRNSDLSRHLKINHSNDSNTVGSGRNTLVDVK